MQQNNIWNSIPLLAVTFSAYFYLMQVVKHAIEVMNFLWMVWISAILRDVFSSFSFLTFVFGDFLVVCVLISCYWLFFHPLSIKLSCICVILSYFTFFFFQFLDSPREPHKIISNVLKDIAEWDISFLTGSWFSWEVLDLELLTNFHQIMRVWCDYLS